MITDKGDGKDYGTLTKHTHTKSVVFLRGKWKPLIDLRKKTLTQTSRFSHYHFSYCSIINSHFIC